jgi:hypothetical protein
MYFFIEHNLENLEVTACGFPLGNMANATHKMARND